MNRRITRNRIVQVGLLAISAWLVVNQVGCESAAMGTLRGARHYTAGSQALADSDGDRAIIELERAAKLVPQASEIQNHLGLAYWSEGQLSAARTSFLRAIELDCENRAAVINLEKLQRSAGAGKASNLGEAIGVEGIVNGE